jgi:hypothetical protein
MAEHTQQEEVALAAAARVRGREEEDRERAEHRERGDVLVRVRALLHAAGRGAEERSCRSSAPGASSPAAASPCRFVAQPRTPSPPRKSTRNGSGSVAASGIVSESTVGSLIGGVVEGACILCTTNLGSARRPH